MTTPSPSSSIPQVAVVGCGYWGKNLVRNLAELGALAALVDSSEERMAELAAKHGGRPASLEEVLSDDAIPGVVIATPGPAHFTQAMAALGAGKHVYVEKPLTMSAAEAEQLVGRAEAWGLTLMVGHILRYHAAFTALLAHVEAGLIGPVRHVVSTRHALGKILSDEDVLWALGPHDLSMVGALMGLEPTRVVALGDQFLRPGVTDMCAVRLDYAGGRSAEVRLSWMAPQKEQRLTVWGETGCLVFDDTQPWEAKLTLHRLGIDWRDPAVVPARLPPEILPIEPGEPLKAECRAFLAAIAGGPAPPSDGREGLGVVRLLARAARSLKENGAPA